MKKIKLLAAVMTLTSCLLLFSVGFSSWYRVEPRTENGSMLSYGVADMDDYIVLATDDAGNSGLTVFEFTALGFKPGKNTISARYIITESAVAALNAAEKTGVSIESQLSYINLSSYATESTKLFETDISVSISYNVEGAANNPKTVTPTVVNNGTDIIVKHDFKNEIPTELTIIYTFNVTSDFRNNFGKYIQVTEKEIGGKKYLPTEFIVSAKITNI